MGVLGAQAKPGGVPWFTGSLVRFFEVPRGLPTLLGVRVRGQNRGGKTAGGLRSRHGRFREGEPGRAGQTARAQRGAAGLGARRGTSNASHNASGVVKTS